MGKASRRRYHERRRKLRSARNDAFESGFVAGVLATKSRFLVRAGQPSMTIARHWAYVKHMLREEGDIHYEFMTARSAMGSEFKHWRRLTRPGMEVPLQVSQGNKKASEAARQAAGALNVPMASTDKYPVGVILADLVVPAQGIQLQRTSQIGTPLAQSLAKHMPFAIAFQVRKWYSPCSARPAPLKRVPFASSSFGVSFN